MPLYVSGTRPSALPRYEGDGSNAREPWWKTPYGRWRLSVEVEAMKRFPDFQSCCGPHGHLAWIGSLRSSLNPKRSYLVTVTYADAFPDEAPLVSIVEPELSQGTPHLLEGNRPCLYTRHGRHGYEPARTTAATLVAWTALWIHAYETWRATGSWPGAED